MPVILAHLAHYLSQHFAVFCCPVELSLSIKLSSPGGLSETAVKELLQMVTSDYLRSQKNVIILFFYTNLSLL